MRTDRTLFDRIGVSCIGGNGVFSHVFSDFFEECGVAFEFPMLEIPAFCQWVTGHEPVYSIHAYKKLFTQEAVFVRYYLEKLWKYMNDIGGKLAVFHAESSVPPSMICPQWFEGEAIYWDVEQGISTSKVIAGDNSKPITFYVQNASEWWRFWEYKVGLNVNIGDGGFNVGLGAGDNTLTISAYNTSVEFVAGIMKLGVTVNEEVNFKNKTAGLYTQAYVRPWSMIGTAVVIYYSAGTLAPLFLSQLKPA